MQTHLSTDLLNTAIGQEADNILRSCVHCGFCLATCPTYQILGDELDGPRGRIYQIKLALEGESVSETTQLHLDRCLTCLNCETTCPSGVQYRRLLDIGREYVDTKVPRRWSKKLFRWSLRKVLPYRRRLGPLVQLGRIFKPMLPTELSNKIPASQRLKPAPQPAHNRKMLMLSGCAQAVMTPSTNIAARDVLGRLGIDLHEINEAGCCGALSQHLGAPKEAVHFMKRNIDAWWPHIEAGAEAIIVTASGCGVMIKDYANYLAEDPDYAAKATKVSELSRDLCEVLNMDDMKKLGGGENQSIVYHSPCTLQHGQKLAGVVESLLMAAGYQIPQVVDSHLCCGSAGTYSILQPALSNELKQRKLTNLLASEPDLIVTANVGCQLHLQSGTDKTVKHWIELFHNPVS